MDFTAKNVVVVGGLGYIGYEASKQFMQKNIAHLTILDVAKQPDAIETLQAINPKIQVRYFKFNLTDKSSIQSAIAAIIADTKWIDILVNAAGILADRNVERTIEVNLIGPINVTLEALPYMDKQRYGRGGLIVNIASVLGLEPCGAAVMYTASKFGLVGFTRSLADPLYYELTGVAVMAVCPGSTDTPLRDSIDNKNDTFDYTKPLREQFRLAKSQSAATCGEHIIRAVESYKNGSLWISDCGSLKEIQPSVYWEPTFE